MKLLIVISPEENIADETATVNALFDEGLMYYHLRKPWKDEAIYEKYLEGIKPKYLPYISLHQTIPFVHNFKQIKRIHIKEGERRDEHNEVCNSYLKDDFHFSTSVHKYETLEKLMPFWEYVFLGPVAESISKPGYQNIELSQLIINKNKKKPGVIALGGITVHNAENILNKGYNGIAVLGTIWGNRGKTIENFKKLQKICAN